ncbi:hypothetical protein C8A03DRAFT_35479 [Achaetomium macrosporum]|uniref:Uncharacterized protein n=1 Tax=Achaetomium macrosporum TaxID=79813 RepID=A0AAN7C732_9PEZI|nr:hypothetical protein C8A03DRAFT_35479 [Achaetomium macrosporum]
MAVLVAADAPPNDQQTPNNAVDGMHIFWILFPLISATALHPLGAAPGFPHDISRYVRILPLCSLLDVLQLYCQWLTRWRQSHGIITSSSARALARDIAIDRLLRNMRRAPADSDDSDDEQRDNSRLHAQLTLLYLEAVPRLLANAAVVLVYGKI